MKKPPPISERQLRAHLVNLDSPERVAFVVGVSRRTVYRWMEFYGIKREWGSRKAA